MNIATPQPRPQAVWAAAALIAAALAGCGKKEEAPAPVAQAPTAASAAASAPEALKVAFVYIGPVGTSGWTYAHDLGRQAVEKEFGPKVKTTFVADVAESADSERVFRDLVLQGNKLIFGTTFGYMEHLVRVAPDAPDVKFEHATGYKTAPNLRVYDGRTYEGAYLAGIVAGGMTKTNTLGFVGSIPVPEVIRNIDAFTLGAQSVNPKVKLKVVWVNSWFDPPKEGDAAQALLNGGADVLLQNTDSAAVVQTAEKAGKFSIGWNSDMAAFAPNGHLASAVSNWGPYYIKAVHDVMDGKWVVGHTWWGVKEGAIDLVSISDKVPADLKAKVEKAKQGLADGSVAVWKGPIVDNAGVVRLPVDKVADDEFIEKIRFYVRGVEGKVPGESKS